jgi:tRNA uridine 5-carbamoylmethylation protein Kti12
MISNCRSNSVVLFCGVPGAGKTTLCKKFCDNLIPEIFCSVVREFYGFSEVTQFVRFSILHIEYDAIYRQLVGNAFEHSFDSDAWKKAYQLAEEVIRFLFSSVSEVSWCQSVQRSETGWIFEYSPANLFSTLTIPLYTNCSSSSDMLSENVYWFILLDDNFMYDSMRRRIFNLCRAYRLHFLIIYVTSDLTTCLHRLSLRENSAPPLDVVKHTMDRFESPKNSQNLGAMTKHTVVCSTDEVEQLEYGALCWHDLFYFLQSNHFQCSPSSPEKDANDNNKASSSEKHQFDLLLRKAVSNIIRRHHSNFRGQPQGSWTRLSKIRKQLLKEYDGKWKQLAAQHPSTEYWESIVSHWNSDI